MVLLRISQTPNPIKRVMRRRIFEFFFSSPSTAFSAPLIIIKYITIKLKRNPIMVNILNESLKTKTVNNVGKIMLILEIVVDTATPIFFVATAIRKNEPMKQAPVRQVTA